MEIGISTGKFYRFRLQHLNTNFKNRQRLRYNAVKEIKMQKIILFFLLIISIGSYSQELTQTIRGTIIDKQTQSPLPGAVISILNTDPIIAASSDENGKFRLENIPIGRKQLLISLISYKEKVR